MKRRRGNGFTISTCVCPDCQNSFPIPRKLNSQREKGHLKTIWCPFCKEEKNMTEYRQCDTYKNFYGETMDVFKKSVEVKETDAFDENFHKEMLKAFGEN